MKTASWLLTFSLLLMGSLSACSGDQPSDAVASATASLTATSVSTLGKLPGVYVSQQYTRTPGPTATQTPLSTALTSESVVPSQETAFQNTLQPDISGSTIAPVLSRTFTPTITLGPSPTRTPTLPIPPTLTVTVPTATLTPPVSPTYVQCDSSMDYSAESTMVELINQQRNAAGLGSLTVSTPLAEAARKHSQDMACRDFYDHKGFNDSTFAQRINAEGYHFAQAAENIYVGRGEDDDPQRAFEAWQSGYATNAQMLNPAYTEVGIGYVYKADSTYGGYFTAVFALPAGGGE